MNANATGLTEELKRRAHALGFVRVGVARAAPLIDDGAHLGAWLAAGFQGPLDYMTASASVRADPTHPDFFPGAQSVVAFATAYASVGEPILCLGCGIARYAVRRDYHTVLYKRLRGLTRWLAQHGYRARRSVDSMPVLERAWARVSGIGFIGKNALLIVPGIGSYLNLSTLITDAPLQPDTPIPSGCGRCRACLDGCPTGALVEPRVVDARRCVSSLTQARSGAIDSELRPLMGRWIFGCDRCQEVCPYNRAALARPESIGGSLTGVPPRVLDAASVLQMEPARLTSQVQGLALRGAGREALARNAAIALGNTGGPGHLTLLRQVAASDESLIVRQQARWAIERIRERIHCT